jgi:hypothetical protein
MLESLIHWGNWLRVAYLAYGVSCTYLCILSIALLLSSKGSGRVWSWYVLLHGVIGAAYCFRQVI